MLAEAEKARDSDRRISQSLEDVGAIETNFSKVERSDFFAHFTRSPASRFHSLVLRRRPYYIRLWRREEAVGGVKRIIKTINGADTAIVEERTDPCRKKNAILWQEMDYIREYERVPLMKLL